MSEWDAVSYSEWPKGVFAISTDYIPSPACSDILQATSSHENSSYAIGKRQAALVSVEPSSSSADSRNVWLLRHHEEHTSFLTYCTEVHPRIAKGRRTSMEAGSTSATSTGILKMLILFGFRSFILIKIIIGIIPGPQSLKSTSKEIGFFFIFPSSLAVFFNSCCFTSVKQTAHLNFTNFSLIVKLQVQLCRLKWIKNTPLKYVCDDPVERGQ